MQSGSKRGRPPEADPRHVARVALKLFERKGFDRVTMDEIAEAASVSRRTLFRLFPSKSDLVWEGLNEVRDAVKLRAGSSSGGVHPAAFVGDLVVPILRMLDEPEAADVARRRLRLVAAAPALLRQQMLLEIEALSATMIDASALPAGTPPSLAARTLVGALFAALLWWAEHGEGMSALDAARAALRTLALFEGA